MQMEQDTFNPAFTGTGNTNQISSDFTMLLGKVTGDMKFVGIFFIIYGAINCLSIIGAILGIPMIICGMRLREAAEEFNAYRNSGNVNLLYRGFESQGRFFFINKVMIIISLVLIVLSIIFFAVFFAAIIGTMSTGGYNVNV